MREDVLFSRISNGHIESLDDVYQYLGFAGGLKGHGLPNLDHRLKFAASYEHFVKEGKQWVLTFEQFKLSHNGLVLRGGLGVSAGLHVPLEVFESVEEHLATADALRVILHGVFFHSEVYHV